MDTMDTKIRGYSLAERTTRYVRPSVRSHEMQNDFGKFHFVINLI